MNVCPLRSPFAPLLAAAFAGFVDGCVSRALVAQTLPPGYALEPVTQSLSMGACLAFTPDGRMLVTERVSGQVVALRGGAAPTTFATVPVLGGASSEIGLLGVAVDPAFPSNGFVYVHYTRGSPDFRAVTARLRDVGGIGTALTEIGTPLSVAGGHAGGVLCVGADGALYLGRGDGHVPESAQQLGSWHGKVLRYALPNGDVPNDNPFVGVPGAEPYAWSIGHRNVFGLTVHPASGTMLCTENGNFLSDEVNTVLRGRNYGWPIYEGHEPTPDPVTEDPLDAFAPEPALTGAAFWTAAFAPAAVRGDWFVGSFNGGEIFQLRLDASGTQRVARTTFGRTAGSLFDVVEGPDGYLYLLHANARRRGADRISRLVFDGAPTPSLHVSAVANKSLGGSVTLGVVGASGDVAVTWISGTQHAQPIPTPFGSWSVPATVVLPSVTLDADRRGYVVVPLPDLPGLRGATLHAQGGTVRGTTIRLTNASSMVLR